MGSYDYLPPIHRPDGDKPFHEDWILYKWFGIKVPRWLDARPAVFPPRVIWGSKELLFNNALAWKNEDKGLLGTEEEYPWSDWGPKPYQPAGKWYLALSFPGFLGTFIPLPYFTFTLPNGQAFRIGVRWSEGVGERYYVLFGLGIKKV